MDEHTLVSSGIQNPIGGNNLIPLDGNRRKFLLLKFPILLTTKNGKSIQCINLMKQVIKKWGNSLGLRIPKRVVEELKLREGSTVEIKVESGKLVMVPQRSLKELLEKIKPETLHKEVDWGEREGNEAW
jgi:antitoxin MazE